MGPCRLKVTRSCPECSRAAAPHAHANARAHMHIRTRAVEFQPWGCTVAASAHQPRPVHMSK
eukprot:8619842-Alexandrium_andersonii.AAC.1